MREGFTWKVIVITTFGTIGLILIQTVPQLIQSLLYGVMCVGSSF